jgi:exocyst complex protein 7
MMANNRRAAYAEESAEVEVLFANMEKLKSLTKKIQGSLNRLEGSGKVVQDAMSPVYGNTQRLQITNNNIDRILEAIDRMREPLDQRGQEEQTLRSDPRKVGLRDYINSLDRATKALRGLKRSNLKSNQNAVKDLTQLLQYGAKQLEFVFREILQEDARPVEPLHYITKGKEERIGKFGERLLSFTGIQFPIIPEDKHRRLNTINSHVARAINETSPSNPDYPTSKAYSEIRGEYIMNSLRNLATASVATARKTDTGVYRAGTNGIGVYSTALEGMVLAEWTSIAQVFPPDEHGRICLSTCQSSVREYSRTLRDLDKHVKENIVTDCYLAFEIIDIVEGLLGRLRQRVTVLEQPLRDAVKPIRETAKSSLQRLMEDAKSRVQNVTILPPDGGAVPVTTDIVSELQALSAYMGPLSVILQSLGEKGWSIPSSPNASMHSLPSLKSLDFSGDTNELFATYAADMLEELLKALESRARLLHKTSGVQGVFMSNNIAIIERMIQSSELQSLLAGIRPRLDSWRKKATAKYLDAWKEPSSQLLDVQYTARQRPPSGGAAGTDSAAIVKALGSKEKDAIKEKFKNFNASFDDLVSKHKGYKMEKEVRALLTREVQAIIEPLYGRFWDRYHEVDKGKGKYVKYDKQQLASTLAGMA